MSYFSINEEFTHENINDFSDRYKGFGKDIYEIIKQELPDIYARLKYYRNTIGQTGDSYAEFMDDYHHFAIQLEPIGEVIVLWNKTKQIEIGTWSEDEYRETINYIKNELLTINNVRKP